jgi:hypothetical protein
VGLCVFTGLNKMEYFEVITNAKTGEQTIRPYTPEEVAQIEADALDQQITSIRARRDNLLAASDWAMTPDAPTDKAAWIAYRAALRDIPQQPGFPYDVAWPEKPE